MSGKERARKSVFEQVLAGSLTLVEASQRLGLSYRQCQRSFKRFKEVGDAGLVHASRGRRSNRRKPESFRRKVIERYVSRYKPLDFGPTLAAEKLAAEGLKVDHETLRRWLIQEGHWSRRRKRPVHRQRRERRSNRGALVQVDGSHHRWFGPDGKQMCLMQLIDDATNERYALLFEEETTEAAMMALRGWIERYGIPRALYADKKSVYVTDREPTLEEQLAGREPLTAFGEACRKLDIEIIAAHSPQAKGRIERAHGVYQDRFCKELALRRITTIKTANKLLESGFTDQLNEHYAVAPKKAKDLHRKVPKGVDLDHVFCFEELRQVQNDWTIRWRNQYFQILSDNKPLPKPKEKVLVRKLLDGSVHLVYQDKLLNYRKVPLREHEKRQERAQASHKPPKAKAGLSKPSKPAYNHPWRGKACP